VSAAEVLAEHEIGREGFCCNGCDWSLPAHVAVNDGTEHAAHVLDALEAAGYAVVGLPDPVEGQWHDPLFDWSVWPRRAYEGDTALSLECTLAASPDDARRFAAALLAAADAAEAAVSA
jgi:hypothetical protein